MCSFWCCSHHKLTESFSEGTERFPVLGAVLVSPGSSQGGFPAAGEGQQRMRREL